LLLLSDSSGAFGVACSTTWTADATIDHKLDIWGSM